MIEGHRILALVPARGGSKGVPGKNLRLVAGEPLLALTIRAAKRSAFIDQVVVSTDDHGIAAAARLAGADVPFMRPAELSTDHATTADVVLHALHLLPEFQMIVLLQPTSPLRTEKDIDAAITLCVRERAPSCVSVTEAPKSPYWMFQVGHDRRMTPLLGDIAALATRRQDLPRVYMLNGAIYVSEVSAFLVKRSFLTAGTIAFEMPLERSLDIDTEADFAVLEHLLHASL